MKDHIITTYSNDDLQGLTRSDIKHLITQTCRDMEEMNLGKNQMVKDMAEILLMPLFSTYVINVMLIEHQSTGPSMVILNKSGTSSSVITVLEQDDSLDIEEIEEKFNRLIKPLVPLIKEDMQFNGAEVRAKYAANRLNQSLANKPNNINTKI